MALNSPLMVMQAFNSRKKKSRCDVMSFTTTQAFDHKSLQQTLPPLLSLSQHIGDLGRCQFSSWQRTAGHTASHLALFHIYLVKTYWLLPGLIRDPRNLWMFMKNIFFRTSAKTWLLNRDEVVWNLKRKKKTTFSLHGFKKHSIHFTSNQFNQTNCNISIDCSYQRRFLVPKSCFGSSMTQQKTKHNVEVNSSKVVQVKDCRGIQSPE